MDLEYLIQKFDEITKDFNMLYNTCKIEEKNEKLKVLHQKTCNQDFYIDPKISSSVLEEIKILNIKISKFEAIKSLIEDFNVYIDIAKSDNDFESYKEAEKLLLELEKKVENLKIESLLSDKYDSYNAIISIHPGAGGTESQDWAEMLFRMYQKWALKSGYTVEVLDMQSGDEAGIKSVSFLITGDSPYGYLKGESGVHRLVRISPFDSNKRRHTSFAAVEVMPEINNQIEVNINPDDLEIDTFRASGAGGQHINKTDSAIRIKHLPTGIVVSCQTQRSQIQNREYAMKMLTSKLFEYERHKKEEEKAKLKGESLDIAWGNQIRSYVFCPYTLVKDHRTNFEVGNVASVMDGKIDEFMYEYLKYINKA